MMDGSDRVKENLCEIALELNSCNSDYADLGSYDCPQVWTLRRYRDHVLYASVSGRLFIRLYYFLSPKLVHCFGNQQFIKRTWKAFLDMKINKLKEKGFPDTPYCDL